MNSNWATSKARSQYHFDNNTVDPRWDCVIKLGRIELDWGKVVDDLKPTVSPATWATRGYKASRVQVPSQELASEEYDLVANGMSRDLAITHIGWSLPDDLVRIRDEVALAEVMARVHCQKPGELWNLHIDKLHKWAPDKPDSVVRIFIQMTDWQPGQFWQFGNYNYSHWRAGDVFTFDWQNVPHCTANAGYHDRYTFQLTGVKTEATDEFLAKLRSS